MQRETPPDASNESVVFEARTLGTFRNDFDAIYSDWVNRNGSRSPSIKYALKWMFDQFANRESLPSSAPVDDGWLWERANDIVLAVHSADGDMEEEISRAFTWLKDLGLRLVNDDGKLHLGVTLTTESVIDRPVKSRTTLEIIQDQNTLPVDISDVEWVLASDYDKLLAEVGRIRGGV